MKKITACLVMGIFILSFPFCLKGETDVSLENKTKAVFIYNFMKYMHWAGDDTTRPFKIRVIGCCGVFDPLKDIEKKKTVRNRKIEVKQIKNTEEIDTCHILFISKTEKKRLQEILDTAGTRNILTISDTEGFAERGVVINFKIIEGKIRFEINKAVLETMKLRISSQLLKLALFVEGKDKDD